MEPNKVYLGNCYELIRQVEDNSVDLIVTDPPYKIEGLHGSGIMKPRKKGNFSREIKESNLDVGIDTSILDEFMRVMKRVNIYLWCNKGQILPYLEYFLKERKCSFEMIVWGKKNPIPFCGTHYLVDKEYCLYFREEGAPTDIPFNRARTIYMSNTNVADKKAYGHPTIKPLDIIKTLIENSSRKGDLVLDPFLGSGTTAGACKSLGRNYIGLEINPNYYKIAVDRMQGWNQRGEMNLFDACNDEEKES